MIETLISILQGLPPFGVLAITFAVAYIENLFPPSPSDVFLVFVGTLVAIDVVEFIPVLLAATAGSTTGFVTAYWLGRRYGRTIIQRGWLPFISEAMLAKVDKWFTRYHDWIIVVNRFLAGTRAVIAFSAGITHMPVLRTTTLSLISAAVWNLLLILAGKLLGSQWKTIESILATYGWVVTGVVVVGIGGYLLVKRRRNNQPPTDT